jgi:hypothetical protein
MRIVLAGKLIFSTEKSSTYTTAHTAIIGRIGDINNAFSGFGHSLIALLIFFGRITCQILTVNLGVSYIVGQNQARIFNNQGVALVRPHNSDP